MFHAQPPVPPEEMRRAEKVYSTEDEVNRPGKPRLPLPPLPQPAYRKPENEINPPV